MKLTSSRPGWARHRSAHSAHQTERERLVAQGLEPVRPLCEVLSGQLEEVVAETDVAASTLIEQMIGIDAAAGAVATGMADLVDQTDRQLADARSLADESSTTLEGLISYVIEFVTSRDAAVLGLLSEVSALGQHAAAIRKISKATKILALNAKIEAVRAGDAGAGFQVVAEEVGSLSRATDEAAAQISDGIDDLAARLQLALGGDGVGNTAAAVANLDSRLRSVADDNASVQQRFGETLDRLHSSAFDVDTEARELTALTTNVLGAVQFQDITRQMVEHVQAALCRLGEQGNAFTEYLSGSADSAEFPDTSLDALAQGYVMDRQRRVHAGLSSNAEQSSAQTVALPTLELF